MDTAAALASIADAGFDLAHAFDPQQIGTTPGWESLASVAGTAILIGNTRALWPRFVSAMRDRALAAERDPLEIYTERTLEAAFPGAPIVYSHRQYGGAFLPFQRLAIATGLGALAPCQLVIHPIYGPWFALRAVIILDADSPSAIRAPIPQPCTCTETCHTTLDEARAGTSWRAWLAVRDACSLRAWRYSDEQIRYHYTKLWVPDPEDGGCDRG